MAFLFIPFHSDLVLQSRDDGLSIPDLGCAMHGHQIAVQDACVTHAHALNAQQEGRRLLEELRIYLIASFDVLFRQNRLTRGYFYDQRQSQLLTQRVFEPNTARGTRQELDDSFSFERTQMILGRVRRTKLEDFCDL